MMPHTGWPEVRVGDLGQVLTGRTPSTKHHEFFGDKVFFITPGDMHQGKHVTVTERGLSQAGADLLRRIKLPTNSVCVSCIGWQMGETVMTTGTSFTNQQINSIIPNGDVNADFLYYSFVPRKQELLSLGAAIGVRTPILKKSAFCDLRLRLPPLPTQRKIAAILSAYDDLIENNTRRIKILEEMAQRIYREWFVNFRYSGHEKVRMVDSPIGKIPEGWEVRSIGEVIEYHIGGGWGKEEETQNYVVPAYVIRGTDIPPAKEGEIDDCPFRFHTESNFRSRKLQDGDIIFEVSGGSKGQPLGRALLVRQGLLNAFQEDVICASFCKLIRPNMELVNSEFLYLHLLEIYDNREITKYQVQSTGISNFKFSIFLESHNLVVPKKTIVDEFGKIIFPIYKQIQVLGRQNSNLRQTRDLLLPKLISGEIDVSELDIETGEGKNNAA